MAQALVAQPTPIIVGPNEYILHSYPSLVTIASADSPTAVAPGSWLKASTNGMIPMVSGDDAITLIVSDLHTGGQGSDGFYRYQGNAPSTDSLAEGYPCGPAGLVVIQIQEDADTTPITDAHVPGYYDVIIGAIDTSDQNVDPNQQAIPSITIDSSSYASTSSGKCLYVFAQAPMTPRDGGNPYSATSLASPRIFLASFVSPAISL